MRITIEPTTKEQIKGQKMESQYPKLILEYPYDHIDLWGWLDIFKLILLNIGFGEKGAEKLHLKEDDNC